MSDSSLMGKVVKKAKKVGSSIYDHRHEIASSIVSGALIMTGELICCAIGRHYGYLDGYSDGWLMCDTHTKEILEASNKSHETIIKQ